MAAAALLLPCIALPSLALDADEAEELVRTVWFEGIPLDQAAEIDAAGAARLVTLLEDPAEGAIHANVLLALGASGQPGAYEAITGWSSQPRSGEVDRATFRAWQVLPHALGALARSDGRALALLGSQLDPEPPGWRFRHHDAGRLRAQMRRAAATGLAGSGRPEAATLLREAETRATDASFQAHLRDCRDAHRVKMEAQAR